MTTPRGWDEGWQPPRTPPEEAPTPAPPTQRPLDGDPIDRVVEAIRAAPRVVWTFGAVVVGALGILEAAAVWAFGLGRWLQSVAVEPLRQRSLSSESWVLLGQAVVSTLGWFIGLVAITVVTAFAACALAQARAGDPVTVRTVWGGIRPRLGAVIGAALTLIAAIVAVVGVPLVAVVIVGIALGDLVLLVPLALVGLAALVALGVWLLPALAVSIPALATSPPGTTARQARAAAFGLVSGQRWRLVGIWLLTTILLAIARGVVAAPFGWFASLLVTSDPLDAATALSAAGAVSMLGATVAAAVTAPVGALVLALVHTDLVARR